MAGTEITKVTLYWCKIHLHYFKTLRHFVRNPTCDYSVLEKRYIDLHLEDFDFEV